MKKTASEDNSSSRQGIFLNKDSLNIRYVPENLLHRDSEVDHLYSTFQSLLHKEGQAPRNFLVLGDSGVGKFALSRFFGGLIEERSSTGDSRVLYAHIDCYECRGNPFFILLKALQRLKPEFRGRGYSYEELLYTLQKQLKNRKAELILCLDKAEFIYHKNKTYRLGGTFDSMAGIHTIHIVDRENVLEKLGFIERSLLRHNSISLRNYSKPEQMSIIEYREALAFRKGGFTSESRELVEEATFAAGGDIGYGVDLMCVAGEIAEEKKERRVMLSHVEEAAMRTWKHVRNRELTLLNTHEKLFLIGVASCLEKKEGDSVAIGEAEKCYEELCKRLNLVRRKHNQILEYVEIFSLLGLMNREITSFGRGGRTSLVTMPEKPEDFLKYELARVGLYDRFRHS